MKTLYGKHQTGTVILIWIEVWLCNATDGVAESVLLTAGCQKARALVPTLGYRVHRGVEGRPPARYASEELRAEFVAIEELRQRRIQRHEFAHGLLNGYELVPTEQEDDEEWQAAA